MAVEYFEPLGEPRSRGKNTLKEASLSYPMQKQKDHEDEIEFGTWTLKNIVSIKYHIDNFSFSLPYHTRQVQYN